MIARGGPVNAAVRRTLALSVPFNVSASMRYSLFRILTAILVIALVVVLVVNQRRYRQLVLRHDEQAEKRERLEDSLERALLDALVPGASLDEHPYYRLLVDEILTDADSRAFTYWVELLAESADTSPSSFGDCELHFFRIKGTYDTDDYCVIVRDNRCVKIVWAGGQIGPR